MTPELPSRRRALVGGIALFLAIGLAFGILAGFFGDRVRFFDTLAHLRAHASGALVLAGAALLWSRLWAAGLASLAAAALGLATVAPYLLPAAAVEAAATDAPRYTLLQMNLRFDAPDKGATLRLIGERLPDVVTVQEMTRGWRAAFETLSDRYPYQYYCAPPEFGGDAAILSRRPFADGDKGVCDIRAGFAAKRIDFNGMQLVVGSQHLRWPWPGGQWRQIERVAPTLALLGNPLIIAGDFNTAPWSAAMRALAAAGGTRIVKGIGPTWFPTPLPAAIGRHFGLPIDNVLASDGVEILAVTRPAATTSDHLPVLVTFTLRFARPDEPRVQTVRR